MPSRFCDFPSKIFSACRRLGPRIFSLALWLSQICITHPAAARIRDYTSEEADHVAWVGLHFPVSNHFSLRRKTVNFRDFIDDWADGWMSLNDPQGIYFLEQDRKLIAAHIGKCTHPDLIDPNVFSVCVTELEKILFQRITDFQENVESEIHTLTEVPFSDEAEYLPNPESSADVSFSETPEARNKKLRLILRERIIEDRLNGLDEDAAVNNLRRWVTETTIKQNERTNIQRVQDFLNAFYGTFDPHTKFMGPESSTELSSQLKAESIGIGVVFTKNEIGEIVAQPMPGSPGEKAGMIKGDVIVGAYDGEKNELFIELEGESPAEVSRMLQRKAGDPTRLKIRRSVSNDNGLKGIKEFDLQIVNAPISRDEEMVRAKVYTKGKKKIFAFSAGQFYQDIAGDINDMYRTLKKSYGRPDGMVLDLSGNPGGGLAQAQEVAGLFVKDAAVAQTSSIERTQLGSAFQTNFIYTKSPEVMYDGPLVVKIDELSSSASEIVAAFLQDSGRALLVGHRSFGKGTIQRIFPAFHDSIRTMLDRFEDNIKFAMPNSEEKFEFGSIRMTVGKYYRISGNTTQYYGVQPNLYLYPKDLPQLDHYESSLKNSLTPDIISSVANQKAIPDKFVRASLKRADELQRNIFLNVDLGELSYKIQQDRLRATAPLKMDLEERLKQQQSRRTQDKILLSHLQKSASLPGVVRRDFYTNQGQIASSGPVMDFKSSSEAEFARYITDTETLDHLKFSFEKSRIEMNEILKLFFKK